MDFTEIDGLLKKLKNLEREENCCKWEIKHSEQRLEETVNARLQVFKALAKQGIRNTFDLKVYLTLRKAQANNDALVLNDQGVISHFQ